MRPTAAVAMILGVMAFAACGNDERADPRDARQVASGKAIYERECASCHGRNLEGQPAWRTRLPNGRLPAPPHDDSGHTWHHADDVLFGITKLGMAPPYAPEGYASDMPSFAAKLGDRQIWDVLAYIKSRWSPRAREAQARIQQQRG
ncbi:MAG: c-type cytochrome [Rudaea sp.]